MDNSTKLACGIGASGVIASELHTSAFGFMIRHAQKTLMAIEGSAEFTVVEHPKSIPIRLIQNWSPFWKLFKSVTAPERFKANFGSHTTHYWQTILTKAENCRALSRLISWGVLAGGLLLIPLFDRVKLAKLNFSKDHTPQMM